MHAARRAGQAKLTAQRSAGSAELDLTLAEPRPAAAQRHRGERHRSPARQLQPHPHVVALDGRSGLDFLGQP